MFMGGDRAAATTRVRARFAVSFLVSFSYVRPGSSGHSRPCHRRSQTATTHGEHGPTDLESVLVATPREFESRILRFCDQALVSATGLTSTGYSDEGVRALRNPATASADNPAC